MATPTARSALNNLWTIGVLEKKNGKKRDQFIYILENGE